MTARLANWWCIVQIEIRKRKENAEISQTQPQCRFTTYLYSITWQCMSLGINCGLILQLMFSPGGGCSLAWEGLKWLSWELIVDFKSWHYSLKWEARQLYTWNNALTRVYYNQHCQNIQLRFFKKNWHNTPLQFYVMRKIVSKKPWFQSRSLACFLQGWKRSALREFFFFYSTLWIILESRKMVFIPPEGGAVRACWCTLGMYSTAAQHQGGGWGGYCWHLCQASESSEVRKKPAAVMAMVEV